MGNVPLVAGALRGLVTSGFGVTHDSLLFQAVAVPIITPGGAPIGTLVATRLVDSLLVRDVKAATSSDLLFYARDPRGKRLVSVSTLGHGAEVTQAVSTLPDRADDTGASQPAMEIAGVSYLSQGSALTTAGGDVVGGFVVLRSRDAELTGIASLRRSLALAGVLGLLLSWLAAFVAARRIAQPVRTLAGVVQRAADGEYPADVDEAIASLGAGSEMKHLGTAFASLMADLRDKAQLTGLTTTGASPKDVTEPPANIGRGGSRQIVGASAPRGRLALRPGFAMEPGAVLANRYLIDAVLGSGGLGIVYRARDRVLGEAIALKVLRPEMLASTDHGLTQLADELRVARRISHRNIVRVHDIGEADGITFLSMEYVDGASLATIIESRGALQPAAVLSIARQLVRALAVMHGEGVVHGDLKPSNLLLGPSGVLKVSDFGMSRVMRRAAREVNASDDARRDAVGHLAGAVVGTPEYMAPEQLIGAAATPSSDIYAAGVVLHECLTGTTPFEAETRMTFLAHKLDAAPAAPVSRPVPALVSPASPLEAVIARMMSPTPEGRPTSATVLYDEFARLD
jgi:serine/threonine-protein kinase